MKNEKKGFRRWFGWNFEKKTELEFKYYFYFFIILLTKTPVPRWKNKARVAPKTFQALSGLIANRFGSSGLKFGGGANVFVVEEAKLGFCW